MHKPRKCKCGHFDYEHIAGSICTVGVEATENVLGTFRDRESGAVRFFCGTEVVICYCRRMKY